jgi:hypothetical protein
MVKSQFTVGIITLSLSWLLTGLFLRGLFPDMLQPARGTFLSQSGVCGEEVKSVYMPTVFVNEIPLLREKKSK